MGCLAAIFALAFPRLTLVFLWLFTNFLDRAFDSIVVPVLGFFLVPVTTVIYVLVYTPKTGVSSFGWILVAIGLIIDLGSYRGASRWQR